MFLSKFFEKEGCTVKFKKQRKMKGGKGEYDTSFRWETVHSISITCWLAKEKVRLNAKCYYLVLMKFWLINDFILYFNDQAMLVMLLVHTSIKISKPPPNKKNRLGTLAARNNAQVTSRSLVRTRWVCTNWLGLEKCQVIAIMGVLKCAKINC